MAVWILARHGLMKVLIRALFFILFGVCVIGCHSEKNGALPKKLTLNLQEGEPPSLNPYVGFDLRSRCIFLALFDPLMRRDADGMLQSAAASHYEIDSTKTIYTFHIREHLWSSGKPVTSQDFERAWKYALTPGSPVFRADLFYPIKNAELVKKGELPIEALGVSTPDARTLIVELEHPTPYFLDLTATSFFAPLDIPSDAEPLCFNGPFVFAERVPDQKLSLRANPLYWDRGSVELDEICFTFVRDPMTALVMFEKGELDIVGDPFSSLPLDVIPDFRSKGQLKSKLISRIFYLLLNTESYPFQNKSLRRALGLCIDRKELTDHLFFGEEPTLSPLPKTLSFASTEKDFSQNEKEAVLLFDEALRELNVSRENFPPITLSYAELSGQKRLAEFLQEQWQKKLGVKVQIVCSEWNVHLCNLKKGNYQIGTIHLTSLYQDPMFYFDLFRDKGSLQLFQMGQRTISTASRKIRKNNRCKRSKPVS